MKVLDLFSGLGGWSNYFKARGHEVVTVDNAKHLSPMIRADVLQLTAESFKHWKPDIILASPPCTFFSLTAGPRGLWDGKMPLDPRSRKSVELVQHTVKLIEDLQPAFWIIENPKGKLNTLNLIPGEKRLVTYCKLGKPFHKPTYLYGKFPPSLELPPPCNPQRANHPHLSIQDQPQSLLRSERLALVPIQLSKLVCHAAEKDLGLR